MKTSSKELSCCLCTEDPVKSEFFRMEDGFTLLQCKGCGLIHLKEVSTSAESFLDDVTSEKNEGTLEYWGYPEFFTKHEAVFTHFFEERFQRIRSFAHPEGRWLDVGSGYGLWQDFLDKKGISNFGLEIEFSAYDHARKFGINLAHESIEKFSTTEKYAVITMCDVLEHVEDPRGVLKKCHDLLLPGGLLYIQVPNVIGLKYPFGDSLGLPHHLWQFNPDILMNLCRKIPFNVLEYWTGVQGVIKFYEKGGPGLIRRSLWNLARKTKRGNRLQILVKK